MKITFKRINGEYLIVVNDCENIRCNSFEEAWKKIFELQKEVV